MLIKLLALGVGPANDEPEEAAASPEEVAPPPADARAEAKAMYAAGRYLEAARAYEANWRRNGHKGSLYNAGMAREAAGLGNIALAVYNWRRYLAEVGASVSGAERQELARRIEAAEGKLVKVELVAQGDVGGPRRVELKRGNASAADQLVIAWEAGWSSHTLHLDPGGWSAVVVAGDGSRQTRTFSLTAGAAGAATPVQVLLRADRAGEGGAEGGGATRVGLSLRPTRALARLHARAEVLSAGEEEWLDAEDCRREKGRRGTRRGESREKREKREKRETRGAGRAVKGVEVVWVDADAEEGAPAAADPVGSEWYLRPGAWRLRAWAPGFRAAELALAVEGEPLEVTMRLRRDALGRARIGVAVGEGLGSVGLMVGGGVILGMKWPELRDSLSPRSSEVTEDDLKNARVVSEGWWLLGGGGGLGLVALTVAAGGEERALGAEATLGGAALAVALPLMINNVQTCYERATIKEKVNGCYQEGFPAAVAVGAGAGMFGGALLALVSRAAARSKNRARARRASLGGSVGWGSVSVSGRF